MGDALGDFFAKKSKKKIKGSNLNQPQVDTKAAPKKAAKDAEEEGWEEEQVVASTIKVEALGKLTRDEDKKEEEDTSAPAWGRGPKSGKNQANDLNERKYPSLAKSVHAINIDDGSDGKVNIQTSKSLFAAFEDDQESDGDQVKRPKEIKPAMVQKKKGERETVALKREVDKYHVPKGKKDKSPRKEKRESGDEGEEDEDESSSEEEPEEVDKSEIARENKAAKARETEDKKNRSKKEEGEKESSPKELEEDLKIEVDLVASKAKYQGRRRMDEKDLPRSEFEEEKESKPEPPVSKKKKKFADWEEDDKPKLAVCPDDF